MIFRPRPAKRGESFVNIPYLLPLPYRLSISLHTGVSFKLTSNYIYRTIKIVRFIENKGAIKMLVTCPECGNTISETARFCLECGMVDAGYLSPERVEERRVVKEERLEQLQKECDEFKHRQEQALERNRLERNKPRGWRRGRRY